MAFPPDDAHESLVAGLQTDVTLMHPHEEGDVPHEGVGALRKARILGGRRNLGPHPDDHTSLERGRWRARGASGAQSSSEAQPSGKPHDGAEINLRSWAETLRPVTRAIGNRAGAPQNLGGRPGSSGCDAALGR